MTPSKKRLKTGQKIRASRAKGETRRDTMPGASGRLANLGSCSDLV